MSTRITVMYDVPQDPDVFEDDYDAQMKLATELPRLQRIETHRVWPTEQARSGFAYRIVELYFDDPEALWDAMATHEAGSLLPSILQVGADGVHILFQSSIH